MPLLSVLPFVLLCGLGWQRLRGVPDAVTRDRVFDALAVGDQARAERDVRWLSEHAEGVVASQEAQALAGLVRHARPGGSVEELAHALLPFATGEGTPATLLARRACLAAVRARVAQGDPRGALSLTSVGSPLLVREPALGTLLAQSADTVVGRCGQDRACALREARAVATRIPGLLTNHSVASVQRDVLARLDITTVEAEDPATRARQLRLFIKHADEVATALPEETALVAQASAAIDKASRDRANTGLVGAPRAVLEESFGSFEARGTRLVVHALGKGETVSAAFDPQARCEGLRMAFPRPIPVLWTPEAFVRLALGHRAKLHVAPQGNGDVSWKEGKVSVTAVWRDGAVQSISAGLAREGP